MKEMILFPNIGLTFEHVKTGIPFWGFEISFFGILLGVALLLGIGVVLLEVYNTRQNLDEYLNLSIMTVIVALVGARLYYVIFSWENYRKSVFDIVLLRKGGMSFYGALLAGLCMVLIYASIHKTSAGRILDTSCVGIAAGQIVCSFCGFFSREGFGDYTEGLFAMQISLESISYQTVTENMRKHIELIDGERFVQVEPLFLVGFIWSIVVLMSILLYKYRKKFEGELFLIYLLIYSFGNFWLESVRADALMIQGLNWKVDQVVSGIVFLVALISILYMWTQNDKARMRRVREKEARRMSQKKQKKIYSR